jgi:hypothetical protein
VVYLLGALLDGVEKVHRHPEAVCRKSGKEPGVGHGNQCGSVPFGLAFGRGVHLLFAVLSMNEVIMKAAYFVLPS